MKCYPSYFVPHYFHDKYTAVRRCCCMDPVNCICCNVYRTLESECHVRSPEIVINRLRKCYHIKSFFSQHIGWFVCSIPSQNYQAVQIQLVICVFHRLYFVNSVLIRYSHQLKRLSGCSQDRSAKCQDSRKIFWRKHLKIRIDQTLISILKSINLYIIPFWNKPLYDASHCCIQCLAVAATCKHSNS